MITICSLNFLIQQNLLHNHRRFLYWFIFDIHNHYHLPARICHLDHIPRIRPSQAGRIRQPGSLFSQISHKDCHPLPLPQIDHVAWVVKKWGFMLLFQHIKQHRKKLIWFNSILLYLVSVLIRPCIISQTEKQIYYHIRYWFFKQTHFCQSMCNFISQIIS